MRILLAEHHGLCFGVRDALARAETLAAAGPLTILGELVHNPVALARLQAHGARQGDLADLASAAPNARVLVTAHGASDERRGAWRAAGFQVHDTTCPLVRRAHAQLAALVAAGYQPVVIGRADHAEVRGLTGDFPGTAVIENEADVADVPAATRYGVIAQTTQPSAKVRALVDTLRAARPEAEVVYRDTICQPTKDRQAALAKLLAEAEVVVVVGGRGSNNTRQLVLAAQAAGRRAHQIERADELDPAWLDDVEVVGLTAGTSTLPETVRAVRARLEEFAAASMPPSRLGTASPARTSA